MSRGPSALRTSRMLDVPVVSPEPHLRPYCSSLCVAPSAVFPDYDRVMARLAAERGFDDGDSVDEEAPLQPHGERETEKASENVPVGFESSDSEVVSDLEADRYDDREYQEKRRVRYAATDISNTYSSRATRDQGSKRKARRSKPYESKGHFVDRYMDTNSPGERCPYANPDGGKRCRKINKTPQEAARHWRSCHVYKEAKAMLSGFLAVGQGTAITSEEQLEEVTPRIQCLFCNALITRSDAMRRHARTNCRAPEEAKARGGEARRTGGDRELHWD